MLRFLLNIIMFLIFTVGRLLIIPLTLIAFMILKAVHNAKYIDIKINQLHKISRNK